LYFSDALVEDYKVPIKLGKNYMEEYVCYDDDEYLITNKKVLSLKDIKNLRYKEHEYDPEYNDDSETNYHFWKKGTRTIYQVTTSIYNASDITCKKSEKKESLEKFLKSYRNLLYDDNKCPDEVTSSVILKKSDISPSNLAKYFPFKSVAAVKYEADYIDWNHPPCSWNIRYYRKTDGRPLFFRRTDGDGFDLVWVKFEEVDTIPDSEFVLPKACPKF